MPGLTGMVKHEDQAMTWYYHGDSLSQWYDHGDPVSPWCGHGKIMAWPSWKIACSCHDDHGHYYKVVRTLIIQPTLLVINEVVVRYFLKWNMSDEPIRNNPKDFQ